VFSAEHHAQFAEWFGKAGVKSPAFEQMLDFFVQRFLEDNRLGLDAMGFRAAVMKARDQSTKKR